jgi:hypothetical protein
MHQASVKLAQFWSHVQTFLFPFLTEELGVLTEQHRHLVAILELVRIEEFIPDRRGLPWRPARDRAEMARAFVAKAVFNFPETRDLLERLRADGVLRRICGWETVTALPSEAKFSRGFADFARTGLPQRVHEQLIAEHQRDRIVGHISRDSTEITGREAPRKKVPAPQPVSPRRGRPPKGTPVKPAPPTRLERQQTMTLAQMLDDLPKQCDIGCKRNSKGHQEHWIGYKLHWDVADGQIPISCILTSASTNDGQVALPLLAMTDQRVTHLYDLMDAAYDAQIIRARIHESGHVPIIDRNPKRDARLKEELVAEEKRLKLLNMKMPESVRFKERTTVERANARLKGEFGGSFVRVRGHAKVMAHLMFGILALTADQLLRLVT